jgi:hypothetical protein
MDIRTLVCDDQRIIKVAQNLVQQLALVQRC